MMVAYNVHGADNVAQTVLWNRPILEFCCIHNVSLNPGQAGRHVLSKILPYNACSVECRVYVYIKDQQHNMAITIEQASQNIEAILRTDSVAVQLILIL